MNSAATGSQRRPGGFTLSALRSIVSDFSSSLLSSVIVHFHPAARLRILRGGIVRAGILGRGRFACLAMERAVAHILARRARIPCEICSILADARRHPFEDACSPNLKPNSDGGKSCNQRARASDSALCRFDMMDAFCGQTLSRLRHIRLKITQSRRPEFSLRQRQAEAADARQLQRGPSDVEPDDAAE
jgi:hypothetical protein